MSWNVSVFIDQASSLDALADEIGILLGIKFERILDGMLVLYVYSGSDFLAELYCDHGMVNDRDLNFEDYACKLIVWRQGVNPTEAEANTLKFARLAFAKLKETGRYALLLVQGTQRKLDSFRPP